jgi:murein endopeptidase
MRSLLVAASCLAALTASASVQARPHHASKGHHATHARRRIVSGHARPAHHEYTQSVGVPWDGELHHAARLPVGDGYHIRRPARAFGTRTTVSFIERVIARVRARFPHEHVLAIGDLSASHGGHITMHHSHQSGRDADIGLFYKHKPAHYPASFVHASAKNLDCAATYALVRAFARTEHADGGVQMMFLDYDVQGLLYRWARQHHVSEKVLDHIFQYPRGKHAGGLVRHWPHHDNHLHVRFKCLHDDPACRR